MSQRLRSIFISDVHLGTPDCRADYLLDFLRSVQCETLYLVGDIIDLEALAKRRYWPPLHAAVVSEIVAIAAAGTRVIYIPGNHDAELRRLCGRTIAGIQVRRDAEHRGADGRRFRVSHGDEFDMAHIGKSWLQWIGDLGHRGLSALNRGVNGLRRRMQLPYFPLAIITKSRLAVAMSFIADYQQRVARHAADTGFDGHICGHIHFGAIRDLEGIVYINDGDWVEHCTALVEHPSGSLDLLHWSERTQVLASSPARAVACRSMTPEAECVPVAERNTEHDTAAVVEWPRAA